ncbi:hypothetical protein PGO03_19575 [Klebsiella aerogenes]|nr:hypothetical protein [Klebsiella aerogenes]
MLAKYINMALLDSEPSATCQSETERDELSEVVKITSTWTFPDGVVIQCIREDELFQESVNQCPECWINWTVIESAGFPILPRQKNFFNFCQQRFWLRKNIEIYHDK